MSSARGGTSRGRGRGSTQQPAARGRGASNARGPGFNTQSSRGNAATRSPFTQGFRGNATRSPRGSSAPRANASSSPSTFAAGALNRAKSTGSPGERFQALTKARERERADAIQRGLIADPEKPRSLADAITPVGTCQEMCPEYERVQRIVQNDVWNEETDPNHSPYATTEKPPDESRMVKKFRRSAAGLEEQLPSDLRPPPVLKQTCDYLLDEMIGKARTLGEIHHFVWDRTRAIRNDFSIQQVQKREELMIAVECYERIARFHIVSLHQLALPEKPYSKYDWQQEREQLDRTLLSLMQLYDDSRERVPLPNEAEFRAYCVILQLQDPTPDLEDRIQSWPRHILQDRRVQKAIEVYMAACNIMDPQGPLKPRADHLIARQDWQKFWTLVASKEVSYLMACAAEVYFNLVRRMVLNAIFRTSWQANSKHRADMKTTEWTIDVLCDLLAFDDGDEVYTYCEHFGFAFKDLEDGQHYLDLPSVSGTSLPEPSAGIPKQSKSNLVEDKRFERTLPAIIDGLTVKAAQDAGLVTEQDEQEVDMDDAMDSEEQHYQAANALRSSDPFDDGESLFIPEKKPSTLFQSQPLSALANGAPETTGGSGSNGGFKFGKPSSFGDTSVFQTSKPQEAISAAPKFDFLGTSKPATTTESPFSFTGTSKAGDVGTTTSNTFAPSAPAFTDPSRTSQDIFAKPFFPPATTTPSFLSSSAAGPTTTPDLKNTLSPKSNPSSFFSATALTDSEGTKADAALSQAARGQSSFTQPPATPAAPPRQPSSSPELKSSQPHFTATPPQQSSTLNPPISTPGQNFGARKLSSSRDHRPEKPSPLSHSFTAGENSSAIFDSHPSEGLAKKAVLEGPFPTQQSQLRAGPPSFASARPPAREPPGESLAAIIERVADEFYTDPIRGILKQYIDYHIRQTVREVQDEIETEQINEEAVKYNRFRLHTKYGRRWRDLFWQKRLAKSGRERRERRRRRLEQRSSQERDRGSIVDALSSRPQSQMSSSVGAEELGVRQSVEVTSHERLPNFQKISHNARATEQAHGGIKRPMSSHGTEAMAQSKQYAHKRMKSTSHIDQRGRVAKFGTPINPDRDILTRSSFLGFSPSNIGGTLKNTMKTSYFRLKAMGVHRVDEEVAPRGTKRPLSALSQSFMQTSPPGLRPPSSLSRASAQLSYNTMMPPPSATLTRPSTANNEDDELLSRLRAARDNLKDGTTFFKSEVEKEQDFRRSLKSSASSNEFESPSMARARSEARLRASQASPSGRASVTRSDVPAYRLRESRFVPREQYGKAIERAREIRESRSRDTSRPESPQMHGAIQTDSTTVSAPAPSFGLSNTVFSTSNFGTQPTKGPNGVSKNEPEQKANSAFAPGSTSTTLTSRPPISFANHTTQMPSENPFLDAATSKPFSGFASQETPALKGFVPQANTPLKAQQPDDRSAQDYTIHPSQINQALANSWGSSHGYGTNKQLSVPHEMETPPQQDPYLHSQAISLLSDDDEEAPQSVHQKQQGEAVDTEATEDVDEELVDEGSEDDEPTQMNGHDNSYSSMHRGDTEEDEEFVQESEEDEDAETNGDANPYALLARQTMDEDQESFDSHMEEDERYDQKSYADRIPNGYGNSPDGDEEAIDGDIDEDDTEEAAYDEDAEEYDYSDEEGDETQLAHWRQQQYDARWASQPAKSPPLQGVGDTAEEAIELSD